MEVGLEWMEADFEEPERRCRSLTLERTGKGILDFRMNAKKRLKGERPPGCEGAVTPGTMSCTGTGSDAAQLPLHTQDRCQKCDF